MNYLGLDQQQDCFDGGIVSLELNDAPNDKLSLTIGYDPYNRYLSCQEIVYVLDVNEAKQMIETLQSFVNEKTVNSK